MMIPPVYYLFSQYFSAWLEPGCSVPFRLLFTLSHPQSLIRKTRLQKNQIKRLFFAQAGGAVLSVLLVLDAAGLADRDGRAVGRPVRRAAQAPGLHRGGAR